MNELNEKLDTLCIFRDLLRDPVIAALRRYFESPSPSAYAEFTAELYNANGGNLGEHVKDLCANSENIYVKTLGQRKSVPHFMHRTLLCELEILQELTELTGDDLRVEIAYDGPLPEFSATNLQLRDIYLHRTENVAKYGYGIYARHRMFSVDGTGTVRPVLHPDRISLSDLVDYERERNTVLDNTKALLAGKPAANILLTGDAGTGKSSTVKAVANTLWEDGLRLVEVRKDQVSLLPKILEELSENPLKFVLFIDDLSFFRDDDIFNALKAVLEGSVTAPSHNVVIYATSNRRHVVRETFSDRDGDDIHRNDTMQETLSLSERFGIHVTFSRPDKDTFLHIVHRLAQEKGLSLPEPELDLLAERVALQRGGRSARLARQVIDGLLSR